MSISGLSECVFAAWSPTIGDPTFTGWFTVVAYFLACFAAARVAFGQSGKQRRFWWVLAAILFLLAINKQLDLQTALTAAGRCLAHAQGWYDDRHSVQITFILVIIGTSIVIALVLAWTLRQELAHIWLALLGLAFLLAFVAVRAAGFHNFDQFIGFRIGGVRMNGILELGGITMIGANAVWLLSKQQKE